jgi:hypothetical protein
MLKQSKELEAKSFGLIASFRGKADVNHGQAKGPLLAEAVEKLF